jgi:hypothetical protein
VGSATTNVTQLHGRRHASARSGGAQNIPVGGPETVRLHELTATLSRAWGRELDCECQTAADFCVQIGTAMRGRGLETERIARQMFKAYTFYNEVPEFDTDMGTVLKDLLVRLTPIEEWARTHRPPGWS